MNIFVHFTVIYVMSKGKSNKKGGQAAGGPAAGSTTEPRQADGTVLLVGDTASAFSTPGCGCCSDGIYPVAWADLAELIPQLRAQ